MSFSDLNFLFRFLPIFLIIYYFSRPEWRKYVLILASLVFVAFDSLWSVPLMLAVVIANWVLGLCVCRWGRIFLWGGAALDVAVLVSCRLLSLPLPGVSYLVFSLISYLADVYRGDQEPVPAALFGVYAGMFPRLIAGPIARAGQVVPELEAPECTLQRLERGAGLVILGLAYKVLLADSLAGLWSTAGKIGYESLSCPMAWLCAVGFSLQLYFDFHGCSLMAVGLGRMMGFRLPDNFNFPYLSRSVGEFYRRWHITLGAWFRDYVYIPLGGSRKGMGRTLLHLLVVWLLTGLWHGIGGNFLLWGLFLCFWICLEKLGLRRILDRVPVLGHIYLPIVIVLSWVIFAVQSPAELGVYFSRMFAFVTGAQGSFVDTGDFMRYLGQFAPYLIVGLIFVFPFGERVLRRYNRTWPVRILLLVIFWLCVARLSVQSGTPFLYAQF